MLVLRAEDDDAATPDFAIVISVAEQKLAVVKEGALLKKYPISTSKFGLGDSYNSYKTPLGHLRVCDKIGDNLALGSVLKCRRTTGEILPVNAPGRDPIVTRILWLEGLEARNVNAKSRGIYIHGTVEEARLGEPVSYGCIRMRSRDVVEVFDETPLGTPVMILAEKFPRFQKTAPAKPEVILASNDGTRGQVILKSRRVTFADSAADKEPPAPPTPAKGATKPAATKPPEVLLAKKTPETSKKAAGHEPAPNPVAAAPDEDEDLPESERGPTIVFTHFPVAKAKPPAEPLVILRMNESMLTADLRKPPAKVAKAKSAAAPAPTRASAPAASVPPPAKPAEPRMVVIEIQQPIDFLASAEEARRLTPLDELSAHLLNPPTEVRLAFRTKPAPAKL